MTTLQTPWTAESFRVRAARRHRFEAIATVLVFALAATATIWQLVLFTGTEPTAAPPEEAAPPAALPADDDLSSCTSSVTGRGS